MPWSSDQFELAASSYHEASCVEIKKNDHETILGPAHRGTVV
jgi:hypothetical protein